MTSTGISLSRSVNAFFCEGRRAEESPGKTAGGMKGEKEKVEGMSL